MQRRVRAGGRDYDGRGGADGVEDSEESAGAAGRGSCVGEERVLVIIARKGDPNEHGAPEKGISISIFISLSESGGLRCIDRPTKQISISTRHRLKP